MRVVIAGAGSVGRSIARELLRNGHHVLLVDRDADGERVQNVPEASWLQADACEIEALGVENGRVTGHAALGPVVENLSSFGEDADGELYAMSLSGGVYRIAADP